MYGRNFVHSAIFFGMSELITQLITYLLTSLFVYRLVVQFLTDIWGVMIRNIYLHLHMEKIMLPAGIEAGNFCSLYSML